jgi:hypothetical protein
LTTSQQATPTAEGFVGGENIHFSAPVVASGANRLFGKGPTTYSVSSTTIAADSWPLSLPTEKLQDNRSCPTFSGLIWSSSL